MTKRSIQEIDKEIDELSHKKSDIYNASMYYDGHRYKWRDPTTIPEINRIIRRVHHLYYERNQARFRDWTKKMNQNKVF